MAFAQRLAASSQSIAIHKATGHFYPNDVARKLVDDINAEIGDGQPAFRDPTFGGDDASLNDPTVNGRTPLQVDDWKRIGEISNTPSLFADGVDASDIAQGFIGNCWFCASISAVAGTRPELIADMFYPAQHNPKGIYAVTLWIDGRRMALIIDDSLPVKNGRLHFARNKSNPNEFWFALLEKTFAKLSGCYQRLIGPICKISEIDVLRVLTGGSADRYELKQENFAEHWDRLRLFTERRWVATTCTKPGQEEAAGLVSAHSYTVLKALAIGGVKLVQLRNTWGDFEWRGDWSDSSALWQEHQAVAAACGYGGAANDGIFWMSYDDFTKRFAYVNLARILHDEFPFGDTVDGEWTSAEQQQSHKAFRCDQIYVDIDKTVAMAAAPSFAMGLRLTSGPGATRIFVYAVPDDNRFDRRNNVGSSALWTSVYRHGTAGEFEIPDDVKRLLVIPASSEAAARYSLYVRCTRPVSVRPALPLVAHPPVEVKFPAGGCQWQSPANPRVHITTEAAADFELVFTFEPGMEARGVVVVVGRGHASEWPQGDTVAAAAPLVKSSIVVLRGTLDAGAYTAWVTFQTAADGGGSFAFASSARARVEPAESMS